MDVTEFLGLIVFFDECLYCRIRVLPIISWLLREMGISKRFVHFWITMWIRINRIIRVILQCAWRTRFITCRHAAAAYGNLDVLQLLISRGGSILKNAALTL